MATKKIAPMPYVGCEKMFIYTVDVDTAEEYSATNILEFEKGSISASFENNTEVIPFYADNVQVLAEHVPTPSASIGYAGDNEEIDVMLYGKTVSGGAVLDNLGALPECGLVLALNQGKGEFVVRQYLKFTASKDGTEVTTKQGTVSFTTPTATLTPVISNHFGSYLREFYSTNPAIQGKTIDEVVAALMADVSHEFTDEQVV